MIWIILSWIGLCVLTLTAAWTLGYAPECKDNDVEEYTDCG